MPASVHKELVDGSDIVSGAIFPVSYLSDEAQEFRNKDHQWSGQWKIG
jgi:hypothetical protein